MRIRNMLKGGLLLALVCLMTGLRVNAIGDYSRFSMYLDVMKEDAFIGEVTIHSLKGKEEYQKGIKANELYNDRIPVYAKTGANIGFYVDNEYYVNEAKITQIGRHKVEVVPYRFEDNILKPKRIKPLESFYIDVKSNQNVALISDTVYLETFDTVDTVLEKIKANFREKNAKLTDDCINKLTPRINRLLNDYKLIPDVVELEVSLNKRVLKLKLTLSTEDPGMIAMDGLAVPYDESLSGLDLTVLLESDIKKHVKRRFDDLKLRANDIFIDAGNSYYPSLGNFSKEIMDVFVTVNNKITFKLDILIFKEEASKESNIVMELDDYYYSIYDTEIKGYRLYIEVFTLNKDKEERFIYTTKDLALKSYNIDHANNRLHASVSYKDTVKSFVFLIKKEAYFENARVATKYNYIILDDKTDLAIEGQVTAIKEGELVNPKFLYENDLKIEYTMYDGYMNLKLLTLDDKLLDSVNVATIYKSVVYPNAFRRMILNFGRLVANLG